MLGWHVSVYRQPDGGHSPATFESPSGTRLAVWQTGWDGLHWLDALAVDGKAVALGGNGYPNRYTARAEILLPHIVSESFPANETWVVGEGSYFPNPESWAGETQIDQESAKQCRQGEWLMVEAWDES
jgi:hypothetical protein